MINTVYNQLVVQLFNFKKQNIYECLHTRQNHIHITQKKYSWKDKFKNKCIDAKFNLLSVMVATTPTKT